MPLPLIFANPGERIKVIAIRGGIFFKEKMMKLGIHEGVILQVLSAFPNGPMIVLTNQTKIILGRKMSEKIEVEPI